MVAFILVFSFYGKTSGRQPEVELQRFVVVTGSPKDHPVQPLVQPDVNKNITLKQICSCESGRGKYGEPNQWESDGVTPLVGKLTPPHLGQDIGMCQINTKYHLQTSISLGYDIYTPDGNWGYATYLFNSVGKQPWSASKPCWNK